MFLLTALNISSPPAGKTISPCSKAISACMSILLFGKAKHKVDTVDQHVYYTFYRDTGLEHPTRPIYFKTHISYFVWIFQSLTHNEVFYCWFRRFLTNFPTLPATNLIKSFYIICSFKFHLQSTFSQK